jgi:hypothetical protein
MWAVNESRDSSRMKSLATKSRDMKIGSLGVLWRTKEQFFTTPFIVYSKPDTKAPISDVWPETWVLPFRIHPLGTPRKRLGLDEARKVLPVLKARPRANITHVLRVNALTSFVPSQVSDKDWEVLLTYLAD